MKLNDELIVKLIVKLFSRLEVEFSEMKFDVADELLHVS
jgi:hypothetical protein